MEMVLFVEESIRDGGVLVTGSPTPPTPTATTSFVPLPQHKLSWQPPCSSSPSPPLCFQDASVEGHPESSKSVVLITGTAEYNMVSLDSSSKACLWEMGSPFLPCRTRNGVLVAKAHSLQ
ncbi:pentatricopeptide repeat-containing protein At3g18110, chloroplastic-like [Gastrolobium bilobum]|uniref:pentatricopeptide repeat-containing protein At3g18110, chloroplastic-like n=1 Tax=Gastrolobium bilobum TaxID=150636 RepID=UPI002AB085FE|nr:pentatricopeptide repeat-containing protein At3g18110, chloroplastic-like [Gastrolobium bilobum]